MAQPTNTTDSYELIGKREDLSDVIYNIAPEETPFFTRTAKTSASNQLHEWQTDTLRAAADNAHIEGDDTVAQAITPTVRLGNRLQIFKDAIQVSGSDSYTRKAGRAREMAYQIVKTTKEHKRDIERALFLNQAAVAADSLTARRLAGTGAWVTTNVNKANDGTNPTGNGTNARTDGTQRAFSQTFFDDAMQKIWDAGGEPDTVYLSSYQMNIALGFIGNNNQRSNVEASGNRVIKNMQVYVTPWGDVNFVPSRHNRGRDVWIMQDDMWAVAVGRPTATEELAKTGDSDKRQIVTELTLVCRNEAASGLVADCSTS